MVGIMEDRLAGNGGVSSVGDGVQLGDRQRKPGLLITESQNSERRRLRGQSQHWTQLPPWHCIALGV